MTLTWTRLKGLNKWQECGNKNKAKKTPEKTFSHQRDWDLTGIP